MLNSAVFAILLVEAMVAVVLVGMSLGDYADTTGHAALLVLSSVLLGGVAHKIHAGGESRQDSAGFQRLTAAMVLLSWGLLGLSLVRVFVSAWEAWL